MVQVNQRMGSPVLAILDRWIRWFGFALGAALICRTFALIDRPYWMLAAAFCSVALRKASRCSGLTRTCT